MRMTEWEATCKAMRDGEPTITVGGRLHLFYHEWEKITNDPWVLQTIRNGLKIEWMSPPSTNPRSSISHDPRAYEALNAEVQGMIDKGVIQPATTLGVTSAMFTVPKKGGKLRPVWDGRWVNQFIVKRHFQMENLSVAKDLVRWDDWMISVDISDAYLHVSVRPMDRQYLQFVWELSGQSVGMLVLIPWEVLGRDRDALLDAPLPQLLSDLMQIVLLPSHTIDVRHRCGVVHS